MARVVGTVSHFSASPLEVLVHLRLQTQLPLQRRGRILSHTSEDTNGQGFQPCPTSVSTFLLDAPGVFCIPIGITVEIDSVLPRN